MRERHHVVATALAGFGLLALIAGGLVLLAAFGEARQFGLFLVIAGWGLGTILTGLLILGLRAIIEILLDIRARLDRRP